MCEWYQREWGCGHQLIGAAAWCPTYSQTERRCSIYISYVDFTAGDCMRCIKKREEVPVPWEHMIDRSKMPGKLNRGRLSCRPPSRGKL